MRIEPTMDLDQLAERIWVNGDWPDDYLALAAVMRDALVRDADAYDWRATSDVEDVDWSRMCRDALAGAPA